MKVLLGTLSKIAKTAGLLLAPSVIITVINSLIAVFQTLPGREDGNLIRGLILIAVLYAASVAYVFLFVRFRLGIAVVLPAGFLLSTVLMYIYECIFAQGSEFQHLGTALGVRFYSVPLAIFSAVALFVAYLIRNKKL